MYAHWILVSINITVWQTPVSSSNAIKEKVISTFFKISPPSLELLTHSSSFLPQKISFHFILTPVTPWHWFFFPLKQQDVPISLYTNQTISRVPWAPLSQLLFLFSLLLYFQVSWKNILCSPLFLMSNWLLNSPQSSLLYWNISLPQRFRFIVHKVRAQHKVRAKEIFVQWMNDWFW